MFDLDWARAWGRFLFSEYLKRGGPWLKVFLHRTDQQCDRILERWVTLNLEELDFAEISPVPGITPY